MNKNYKVVSEESIPLWYALFFVAPRHEARRIGQPRSYRAPKHVGGYASQ